jgi:hypothetical protein
VDAVLKGGDGGAGELHWITAKLEEGLSWIRRSWGGLPTVSREVAGEELEWRQWIQSSVWNASARESKMEGGEATKCFIPARKGGEACTGARYDDGKVAAGQNSSRGGAAWHAQGRARGEELEWRPA